MSFDLCSVGHNRFHLKAFVHCSRCICWNLAHEKCSARLCACTGNYRCRAKVFRVAVSDRVGQLSAPFTLGAMIIITWHVCIVGKVAAAVKSTLCLPTHHRYGKNTEISLLAPTPEAAPEDTMKKAKRVKWFFCSSTVSFRSRRSDCILFSCDSRDAIRVTIPLDPSSP